MIKLDEIIFFNEGKGLDKIIAEYFEKVNYGQETSDPLFPRKINLSLKSNIKSNIIFCELLPIKIYGYYQSSESLAFYFLISTETDAKASIDKVIGSPDYVAELSAESTKLFNNTSYNGSMNEYEIYLRTYKVFSEVKEEQDYYLITVTSIPLNDLFFFRALS